MLSERQKIILEETVQKYIDYAKPVSSKLIEESCNLNVSQATIRNEMQDLMRMNYLYQPHVSAGRVPTDKGYRFFVDEIIEEIDEFDGKERRKNRYISLSVLRKIAIELSRECSSIAICFWPRKNIYWREGLGNIFEEPEFKEANYSIQFIKVLEGIERNFERLTRIMKQDLEVYIGEENPLLKGKNDFSLIVFRNSNKIFLALFGPKRMRYKENIKTLLKYGK